MGSITIESFMTKLVLFLMALIAILTVIHLACQKPFLGGQKPQKNQSKRYRNKSRRKQVRPKRASPRPDVCNEFESGPVHSKEIQTSHQICCQDSPTCLGSGDDSNGPLCRPTKRGIRRRRQHSQSSPSSSIPVSSSSSSSASLSPKQRSVIPSSSVHFYPIYSNRSSSQSPILSSSHHSVPISSPHSPSLKPISADLSTIRSFDLLNPAYRPTPPPLTRRSKISKPEFHVNFGSKPFAGSIHDFSREYLYPQRSSLKKTNSINDHGQSLTKKKNVSFALNDNSYHPIPIDEEGSRFCHFYMLYGLEIRLRVMFRCWKSDYPGYSNENDPDDIESPIEWLEKGVEGYFSAKRFLNMPNLDQIHDCGNATGDGTPISPDSPPSTLTLKQVKMIEKEVLLKLDEIRSKKNDSIKTRERLNHLLSRNQLPVISNESNRFYIEFFCERSVFFLENEQIRDLFDKDLEEHHRRVHRMERVTDEGTF